MSDTSRISVYSFVHTMFGSLGISVYAMEIPQSLETVDITNGFAVMRINNIYDNSEFIGHTYSTARVFLETYVPAKTKGRLDTTKYEALQNKINSMVNEYCDKTNQDYMVSRDSILNYDDTMINGSTEFFMYLISFTVTMTE